MRVLRLTRRYDLSIPIIGLAAVLCLVWGTKPARPQSGADRIDAQKEKLREIEQDIRRHRDESQKLKAEKSNVLEQLSHLDKEIALSKKYLAGLEEREALLGAQLDSLRGDVVYESAMLDYKRERLAARLRQMYMREPNYEWEIVLGSANLQDALRRYKFTRMVARRDADLIREVWQRKVELETEQAQITETLSDISKLKATREGERQTLAGKKQERVSMLGRIKTQESKHAQAIEELNRSKEKLKDLIGELERKRLANPNAASLPTEDFAKLKGRLMWPVEGKLTKKYGKDTHPRFGTVTFNNGINIEAPGGTPIRAVSAATVEFVDWISGYGNCIILNHGGGYYTLYAHAADIFVSPGQAVAAGQVIAEVGDSGSLDGFECHFEVRKSKQALDPLQWLTK